MNKTILVGCLFLLDCQRTLNLDNCMYGNPCSSDQMCNDATQSCVGKITLTDVVPHIASQSGGIPLTITGTGFLPGTTVQIGGVTATSVTYSSATSLTAVVPANAKACGPVHIQLANPDGGTAENGSLFRYVSTVLPSFVANSIMAGQFAIPTAVDQIVVADLNGDGYDDVALKDQTLQSPSILLFAGTASGVPTYSNAIGYSSTAPSFMRVLNLDQDQKPDILIATKSQSEPTLISLLNKGSFTFNALAVQTYQGNFMMSDVVLSPLAGPGGTTPSLLIGTTAGLLSVASPPTAAMSTVSTVNFHSMALAPLKTGQPGSQLVGVTGAQAIVLDPTVTPFSQVSTMTSLATIMRVGETDGDGKLDLVGVMDNPITLTVATGVGDGSFNTPTTVTSTLPSSTLFELADYECAGNQGVVFISAKNQLYYTRRGTDKTFGTATPLYMSGGADITAFALKDLNHDGRPDIVYSTASGALVVALSSN